ncbi:hypothetical protein JG688_00017563 [Phytophthora aleatoria]|uniref:Uncharacterized protein n=1 Tax=Phytophthora aleatoria TaxID=2496075 RepID=A0A8J5ISG6_9STRA|nr:hypothetical protein JG688_00017563 [Phytophthora aleatoria]
MRSCWLKACKDFSPAERGVNKCAYSTRENFWDVVNSGIRAGFTRDSVSDNAFSVCDGWLSVSIVFLQDPK